MIVLKKDDMKITYETTGAGEYNACIAKIYHEGNYVAESEVPKHIAFDDIIIKLGNGWTQGA